MSVAPQPHGQLRRRRPRSYCVGRVDPEGSSNELRRVRMSVARFGRRLRTPMSSPASSSAAVQLLVEDADDEPAVGRDDIVEQVAQEVRSARGRNVVEVRANVGRTALGGRQSSALPDGDSVAPMREPLAVPALRARARSRAPTARARFRPPPPRRGGTPCRWPFAQPMSRNEPSLTASSSSRRAPSQRAASPEWPDWARGLSPARYAGTIEISHRPMPAFLVDLAALECRVDRGDLAPASLLEPFELLAREAAGQVARPAGGRSRSPSSSTSRSSTTPYCSSARRRASAMSASASDAVARVRRSR